MITMSNISSAIAESNKFKMLYHELDPYLDLTGKLVEFLRRLPWAEDVQIGDNTPIKKYITCTPIDKPSIKDPSEWYFLITSAFIASCMTAIGNTMEYSDPQLVTKLDSFKELLSFRSLVPVRLSFFENKEIIIEI